MLKDILLTCRSPDGPLFVCRRDLAPICIIIFIDSLTLRASTSFRRPFKQYLIHRFEFKLSFSITIKKSLTYYYGLPSFSFYLPLFVIYLQRIPRLFPCIPGVSSWSPRWISDPFNPPSPPMAVKSPDVHYESPNYGRCDLVEVIKNVVGDKLDAVQFFFISLIMHCSHNSGNNLFEQPFE